MDATGKQSVLFINMLPHIYKKILVEGYTHEQCVDWLLTEHSLDIARPTFTSYMKRHGDIKLARERYKEYLTNYGNGWWSNIDNPDQGLESCFINSATSGFNEEKTAPVATEASLKSIDNSIKTEAEHSNLDSSDNESANGAAISSVSQSTVLNLGLKPEDNKFKDVEHPLTNRSRHKKHVSKMKNQGLATRGINKNTNPKD